MMSETSEQLFEAIQTLPEPDMHSGMLVDGLFIQNPFKK